MHMATVTVIVFMHLMLMHFVLSAVFAPGAAVGVVIRAAVVGCDAGGLQQGGGRECCQDFELHLLSSFLSGCFGGSLFMEQAV